MELGFVYMYWDLYLILELIFLFDIEIKVEWNSNS